MSNEQRAKMTSATGEMIPLQSVGVQVELVGLCVTMATTQSYVNPTDNALAVTYTFPLPSEATLLGVSFVVRGTTYVGTVHPLPEARQKHEAAISAGDTALLISQAGGWYTAELGNVGPGEAITVTVRSGQLVVPMDGIVRYAVPTTIAPHYGDARAAGLTAQSAPVTSLTTQYPFEYRATLHGISGQRVQLPSHVARKEVVAGNTTVSIDGATMDRDVVLTVDGYGSYMECLHAEQDGQHWYATFVQLPKHEAVADEPMHVKLLVDCSGSMSGTSIQQARYAVQQLLSELRDGDSIAVTRFGSTVVDVTPGLMTVGPTIRKQMQNWLTHINANLGGTETVAGLTHVLEMPTHGKHCVVVVLTDGEAYGVESVVAQLKKHAHAVFPLIIGHVPSDGGLGKLAKQTGGFLEQVTPNERIDAAMLRMIRRVRAVPVVDAALEHATKRQMWQHGAVPRYSGDHALLTGASADAIAQTLRIGTDTTSIMHADVPVPVQADFVRLVAATRLDELAGNAKLEWAVTHQLVCAETAFVAVAQHAADAKVTEPTIHALIEQQMAAGWHGIDAEADVMYSMAPAQSLMFSHRTLRRSREKLHASPRALYAMDTDMDISPMPASSPVFAVEDRRAADSVPPHLAAALITLLLAQTPLDQLSLALLRAAGVDADIIDACLAITGYDDNTIARALCAVILGDAGAAKHGIDVKTLPTALLGGLKIITN